MNNLSIMFLTFFILFAIVMLIWFVYELVNIKRKNSTIVDGFVNKFKKDKEGG